MLCQLLALRRADSASRADVVERVRLTQTDQDAARDLDEYPLRLPAANVTQRVYSWALTSLHGTARRHPSESAKDPACPFRDGSHSRARAEAPSSTSLQGNPWSLLPPASIPAPRPGGAHQWATTCCGTQPEVHQTQLHKSRRADSDLNDRLTRHAQQGHALGIPA